MRVCPRCETRFPDGERFCLHDSSVLVEEEDGPRTIKQTGLGAQILSTMGLKKLILLTDSPMTRYLGLDAYDLHITGTRPISGD